MLSALYLIFLVGSFSIGYSLLRIGFPEFQEKEFKEKIGMGYLIGLIVFLPSILSVFFNVEKFFFLFAISSYAFIAIVMFIVRTYYKKEETTQLIKENYFHKIPKKALTKEELGEQNKKNKSNVAPQVQKKENEKIELDITDFKKEKAKELGVEEKLDKINHSVTGKNEGGLIIKDSTTAKQRQIFKESQPKLISKTNENNKIEEIEKLKKLAKSIKENVENKKENDDDLEGLNEIDEEF